MTGAAAIVADARRAIALLVEHDDPGATHIAEALTRWLAGEDFESAAGLAAGWRRVVEHDARDAALAALLAVHHDTDDSGLADLITAGVRRADRTRGIRPDGDLGHCFDLARADIRLSKRTWRRLIAEARGQVGRELAK